MYKSHSISVCISLRGNQFTSSCIFIVCMCGMKFRSLLFYHLGTESPWGGITLKHIVYTAFQSSSEGLSTSCPKWWFAWEYVLYWPSSPPNFLAGIFSLSTTSTFTLILGSASKKKNQKKPQTKTPGLTWPHNQTLNMSLSLCLHSIVIISTPGCTLCISCLGYSKSLLFILLFLILPTSNPSSARMEE